MPLFSYKVVDRNGKEIKGNIESDSKNSVKAKFQSEGLYITEIKEKSKREGFGFSSFKDISFRVKKANLGEVASMTRLLATLQKAKIPLVESISAVAEQQENPYIKETLMLVKQRLQEGYSFSKAAREYPDVFSALYCNMLAAAEESGALDRVLLRLADFLEYQLDLKNRVKSAMMYPIILLVVAVLVISVLFVIVIPKLSKMFEDMDVELPLQTKILINMSSFAQDYWWLVLGLFILGVFLFRKYIKSDKGSTKWNRFLITVPIFGRINRMVAISRFAKTLSTLLVAGVPILGALDIVKKVIGNKILEESIAAARENIKEGESIAVPLKRSGEFPPIVTSMIAIGEKSGELEEMLETLAESYEKEVSYTLDKLTAMIEPVMLVVLALIISFIIFSVIVPIFEINDAIS